MKIDMKIAFAVLFATMFLATPLASVIQVSGFPNLCTDDPSWYQYVPGVLDTDTYKLYPYKATSLNIGFSKFGEFINPFARTGTNYAVGLEYADPTDPRDPFANEGIAMNYWLNGWLINVTYVSSILTPSLRNVWAFAEFADITTAGVGKDWNCYETHYMPEKGGRQTSGYAYTDQINVVQNGPRRFVAVLCTHLYDAMGTSHFPLVDVVFTIVFDKAEKNVLVYKDIHYRLPAKEGMMINVQFSNRGQWDLGPAPTYTSKAKYFHQELSTCYGADYLLTPWILRDVYDTISIPAGKSLVSEGNVFTGIQGAGTLDPVTLVYTLGCPIYKTGYPNLPAVLGSEIVTVNGARQAPGIDYTYDPTICLNNGKVDNMNNEDMVEIKFLHDIAGLATIRIEYKNVMKYLQKWDATREIWVEQTESHKYDIAQFISNDSPTPKYVGYAAFWPTCSDYTVDGWSQKFVDLWATPTIFSTDVVPTPLTKIPFLIGEWDFMLDSTTTQFRGVTSYGIVDYHDASNAVDGVIDKEVMYQLNEVFNPWDLNDAVHKQESRWVYEPGLSTGYTVALSSAASTACKPGLDDKIYYAVVGTEETGLGFTDDGWTGYFFRDGGTYPAESKMLNNYLDSSTHGTAHSKNWFALLDSTTEQEMLKVTPRVLYKDDVTLTPLTLQLKDLVDFGFWYRMLTTGTYTHGPHIEIKVYENSDATGKWQVIGPNMNPNKATTWTHYTLSNIEQFASPADSAFQCVAGGTSGQPVGVFHSWQYWADTTRLGNYYVQYVAVTTNFDATTAEKAYIDDISVTYKVGVSGVRYERVYNLEEDKLVPSAWDAYCSFAERVELDSTVLKRLGVGSSAPSAAAFTAAGVTQGYTIVFWSTTEKSKIYFWKLVGGTVSPLTISGYLKILYSTIEENEKGRYEWNIVGANSWPVDSAGAAMVSEYFDSKKDISIWTSALDVQDIRAGALEVPYIFSPYSDDKLRAHVKDSWCTTIPIESSNIIVVGGPLANKGAYYLNDFTTAFYDSANNQIIALSCWSMNAYRNDYTVEFLLNTGTGLWMPRAETENTGNVGYAVISTYKDKNQTVWFDVWGIEGQDTYFATWAIWNTWLGEKLQQEPNCLTTLIVKIDYDRHPTEDCFITIVEALGTISEYNWGKQVEFFSGTGERTTFQLAMCGIDTSRVEVYVNDVLTMIPYTIDEWGTLIFTTAPGASETIIKVVYYLKQPPIHPSRPLPVTA